MAATFGIDFGTTNSLITVIRKNAATSQFEPFSFFEDNFLPHPSVVWYQGGQPIVGRAARDRLTTLRLGVIDDIVRSPKMFLGSSFGIPVGGITRSAADVVGDVLKHLRKHAKSSGHEDNEFASAVITIPIHMSGPARAELREAALKAGIHIHQFVHEPLAALYGYLRPRPDFRQELARLEGRLVLVFDWGGGTLDLTLCQLRKGVLTQVMNEGDQEVGGDKFDLRLRQLIRQKHEACYPSADWSRLKPQVDARLLTVCEDTKILLSSRKSWKVFIPDFFLAANDESTLAVTITAMEFETAVEDLVRNGLDRIAKLLDTAGVPHGAIEYCLATGGMVSMPAIQRGLLDIFGMSGLRLVPNASSVISEGAAWIAHDRNGLRLAKPLELLNADNTYVEIIPAGTNLPTEGGAIEKRIDAYCVDPSDGLAKIQIARPTWPGRHSQSDQRVPYTHLCVPVDTTKRLFTDRLSVTTRINDDLIVTIGAESKLVNDYREASIMDLEFGLSIESEEVIYGSSIFQNSMISETIAYQRSKSRLISRASNIHLRSNISIAYPEDLMLGPSNVMNRHYNLVPGDVLHSIGFSTQSMNARQQQEALYYKPCAGCGRTQHQIRQAGCPRGTCRITPQAI